MKPYSNMTIEHLQAAIEEIDELPEDECPLALLTKRDEMVEELNSRNTAT